MATTKKTILQDVILLPFGGYEAPRIITEGETVSGETVLERTKEVNANSGEKECKDFLAHQAEIPTELCDRVAFVFGDWRHPDFPKRIALVYFEDGRWVQDWCDGWGWDWDGGGWDDECRPVRRSTKPR